MTLNYIKCIFLAGAWFLMILFTASLSGQTPIIQGDSLLCPQSTGRVTTQTFEAYQWYQRFFGSQETVELVGETDSVLWMPYFDFAASYVSVRVVFQGDTLFSEEFFVDGLVFVPAFVISEGNYTVSWDGEFFLCPEDSIVFTLNSTYDTNIQWFRNDEEIEGATDSQLVVREPGIYYVEGAPSICPEFVSGPGVPLIVIPCETTSIDDKNNKKGRMTLFPNPATDYLQIQWEHADWNQSQSYTIYNALGQPVSSGLLERSEQLPISTLSPGLYFFKVEHQVKQFVKVAGN